MRHRTAKPGFGLLLVLVLVVLAGAALTHVAWHSLVGALQSRQQVEELRRRWAVKSLRAALLDRAEELLDAAERGSTDEAAADSDRVYANRRCRSDA